MVKIVEITAQDLRDAALKKGLDPDAYGYTEITDATGKFAGYSVYKGVLSIGVLYLEFAAKALVETLNKTKSH